MQIVHTGAASPCHRSAQVRSPSPWSSRGASLGQPVTHAGALSPSPSGIQLPLQLTKAPIASPPVSGGRVVLDNVVTPRILSPGRLLSPCHHSMQAYPQFAQNRSVTPRVVTPRVVTPRTSLSPFHIGAQPQPQFLQAPFAPRHVAASGSTLGHHVTQTRSPSPELPGQTPSGSFVQSSASPGAVRMQHSVSNGRLAVAPFTTPAVFEQRRPGPLAGPVFNTSAWSMASPSSARSLYSGSAGYGVTESVVGTSCDSKIRFGDQSAGSPTRNGFHTMSTRFGGSDRVHFAAGSAGAPMRSQHGVCAVALAAAIRTAAAAAVAAKIDGQAEKSSALSREAEFIAGHAEPIGDTGGSIGTGDEIEPQASGLLAPRGEAGRFSAAAAVAAIESGTAAVAEVKAASRSGDGESTPGLTRRMDDGVEETSLTYLSPVANSAYLEHPDLNEGLHVSFHIQGMLPSTFRGYVKGVIQINPMSDSASPSKSGRPVSLTTEGLNPRTFMGRVHCITRAYTHVFDLIDDKRKVRVEVAASTSEDRFSATPSRKHAAICGSPTTTSNGPSTPCRRLALTTPRSTHTMSARSMSARSMSARSMGVRSMSARSMSGRSLSARSGESVHAGPFCTRSLSGISLGMASKSSAASLASIPATSGDAVAYFVEGRPNPIHGRVRCINKDGTHTVDLPGGGRMTGVVDVTRCEEREVEKAALRRHSFSYRRGDYDDFRRPSLSNRSDRRSSSRGVSPRTLRRGHPCKFTLEGNPKVYYGTIRDISAKSDYYTVDLASGGRMAKVNVEAVTPCSRDELAKDVRSHRGVKVRKDPLEQHPYGYPALDSFRGGHSVSPERQRALTPGRPVSVPIQGGLGCLHGRVRSVERDGTYTVDVVGGGRKVDVKVLKPCSGSDLELAAAARRPLLAGKCEEPQYQSLNNEPSDRVEGSCSSRASVSPTCRRQSTLGGIAITRVKSP